MKKFFAAVLTAVLGISALCAGEKEEVRALLIKDLELSAQGRLAEALALRTPDFVESGENGDMTYEQCKWLCLGLDGEHPEEFLLTIVAAQSRGAFKTPTPEQMARVRELARGPEFLQKYKELVPQLLAIFKADQARQLKTLKFVSITVDGGRAVAVIEYDSESPNGVKHKVGTITLRKVDGSWKICNAVLKSKK